MWGKVKVCFGIALALITALLALSGPAHAQNAYDLDIPAQSLAEALRAVGQKTATNILFEPALVRGIRSSALRAQMTADEAIQQLLNGTELKAQRTSGDTIVVRNVAKSADVHEVQATDMRLAQSQTPHTENNEVTQKSGASSDSSGNKLQEIVVTATKRAEKIQSVPMSITAITSEEIDRRRLVSAQDYLRGIPGVNQVGEDRAGTIVIRGIQTALGSQNFFEGGTTVATYFGETPTSSSAGVGGNTSIDAKLVDIERVEVLRGPQGTAFGSAALGGVVRTIPVSPKLDRLEGAVGANYSSTSGTGGDNHMIQAIGNVPLIQGKVAVRATAYQFEDSGFYRNAAGSDPTYQATAAFWGAQPFAVDQREVGASLFRGGRIAALYQVNDALKVTLSYLKQNTESDGVLLSTSGKYEQLKLQVAPEDVRRGETSGISDTDIDLVSTTIDYDLGWSSLLATYSHVQSESMFSGPFDIGIPAFPWSAFWTSDQRANSGEIRLATRLDGAWNFLVGLYMEEIDDFYFQDTYWHGNPDLNFFQPGVGGQQSFYYDTRNLNQKAAFGEISWEFAPRFTLTGGVRAYDYERTGSVDLNYFGFPDTYARELKASDTNFSGNLSYKAHENALFYARWAQGFRLGRPQQGLNSAQCDLNNDGIVDGLNVSIESTREVASDDVENYEIGAKLTSPNRRFEGAATVYRMDWQGLPVGVVPLVFGGCNASFTANVGNARSEGLELQMSAYLTEVLRLDAGGAWIRARLTEDAPGINAFQGDRLPGSSKVNANVGLQYEFKIAGHDAFVRTDAIYVGPFYTAILSNSEADALVPSGDYVKVDASARVTVGAIAVDLFVRNLTNADEFSLGGANPINPLEGSRLRPRTIGLQGMYRF